MDIALKTNSIRGVYWRRSSNNNVKRFEIEQAAYKRTLAVSATPRSGKISRAEFRCAVKVLGGSLTSEEVCAEFLARYGRLPRHIVCGG
eukprot:1040808-Prorocentrum_minimum.AAC.2